MWKYLFRYLSPGRDAWPYKFRLISMSRDWASKREVTREEGWTLVSEAAWFANYGLEQFMADGGYEGDHVDLAEERSLCE